MTRHLLSAALFLLLTVSDAMSDPLYGRENLAAFFAAQVRARTTGAPIKIHIVGDSKVAGNGSTDGYRLDQLLPLAAHGYPVQVTFHGFGGQNSYLWDNNEATDFLAEHPDTDLLIVDFGTNEHVSSAIGGPQTTEQTKANHLDAIAKIRAVRAPSQLSILLLGQPPANNWQPAYQQTTEVMQDVNGALKQVAMEADTGFFDTLELFQRAHSEAGWMEQLPSPEYGGGNVHTGNPFNMVFIGELGRYLFPLDFKAATGGSGCVFPSLQNGWTNWANLPEYAPRAQLDTNTVRLSGVIKPGLTGANTTLFTLPLGYRPITNRFFTVSTNNGGTFAEVQVLSSTGAVRIAAAFTGTYIALDPINFRID